MISSQQQKTNRLQRILSAMTIDVTPLKSSRDYRLLRGRLAGIELISYTTGPYLGNAEAGLVASAFGLRASVVSGGVMCVIGSGLLAVLLPAFIRYDGREGLRRKQAEEAERAATV